MVTTKKILAWLCAAAMVLSAMAMPVFADAEVYDSDVHGAVCTERMHNGGVSDGAAVSVPTDQEASVSLMADGEIATVGGIGYTDLQEAVNAAQGTENAVEITSSIIQGTQVDITGAVIINGSGNMITADGTDTIFNLAAANAALTMNNLTITGVVPVTLGMDGQEVYLNDSAIQVVSRDGAYSRGIRMTNQDIVQDIVIRLNHSKILYTSDTVTDYETQTYIGDARGISLFSAQNSKVTLEKNSEISGFGYSINLTGAVDDETKTADMSGLQINVTNSLIRGWTAFNIWGSSAQFRICDSTLKGINVSNGRSDAFAVIVVNDDLYGNNTGLHAENNTFDIQRTDITNYQGGTAEEYLFRIDAFAGVQSISMQDVTFTDTTGAVTSAIHNTSMSPEELETFFNTKITATDVTVTGIEGQELPLLPVRIASVQDAKTGIIHYFDTVGEAAAAAEAGEVVKVLADSVEPERIVITEPISIIGAKADGAKPKISGAISVKLADGETAPVTVSGLEIEHTGVYSADAAQDQKCALAVINGGLIAEDNYIHILTPVAEDVSNSPSALQLAKNATNTAETVYRVSGNTFGYYGQWSEQSGTTAGAVFAPVNYDGVYGEIDVDANAIYQNNVFEDLNGIGSNFLFSIYDYTAGGYRYSAVGSLTGLQDALDAQAPQCTIVLDQEIDGAEAAIAAAAVNPTTTIFYQDDVSGANVTSTADNGEVQISVPGILFDAAVDTNEAQARYYPVIESRGTEIRTDGGQTTAVYTADISIVKEADGTITQVPAANQKVTVALPAAWTLQQGEAAAVYHVTASGREAIDGVTTDGNLVTFIAPSFSEYEFEVALDALAPNTSEAATQADLVLDAVPAESDAFTKVYTLSVQSAEEGKVIAGLTDLAFTANFDKNGTNTTCRIEGANDYAAANSSNGWQLSLSDKSDAMLALKAGEKVVVGKVTFTGYTYDGDTEASATLSLSDITGAYTAAGDVQGSLTITDPAEFTYTNRTATQTITAVISFPNKIQANDAPYQDMTVLIQGSTGQRYEIQLGENLLTDTAGGVYYQIEQEVPAGGRYSVSVSGAGYRTAVKSVTMNQDQTVYFWNNYSDTEGANFLAGDILMDNVIDLYDLNAAVSYFGETNLQDGQQDYAQYDLNRDGKIDSRDVAMVLVSWGK